MGKRLLNLHAWHWRNCVEHHRHPTSLVLNVMAVPLFILAALLIIDGVVSLSFASLAIGVIGLIAALGIQRHGRNG
ncbi:hypothetical protein IV01_24470 [Pseudomonas syringae]|uniref:Terminase n=1 Tax=Pseudomonas syringae TaxID=317 RepID=A0A085V7J4_PSESX|nr:hypothetical protein IV01_24470 [Pseudomonas syringae]